MSVCAFLITYDCYQLYARKLSDRMIPACKRRKCSKRQTSYAISAVSHAQPQGHFMKLYCINATAATLY